MRATILAGAVLLVTSSASFAAPCTSTTSWGLLGPPDVELFGNSFTTAEPFTDCYTFTLSGPGDLFGGALGLNTLFNTLVIDVTSVSLTGGNLAGPVVDNSPLSFSFGGLLAGDYELAVDVTVTSGPGLWTIPVGHAGLIASIAAAVDPPVAVSEPATLSLLALGLAGIAFMRRRKAR